MTNSLLEYGDGVGPLLDAEPPSGVFSPPLGSADDLRLDSAAALELPPLQSAQYCSDSHRLLFSVNASPSQTCNTHRVYKSKVEIYANHSLQHDN